MKAKPLLEVREVTRRFVSQAARSRVLKNFGRDRTHAECDEIWALRGVSLTVARGQIVGITGHNASGKSTLLRIVASVLAPSCGHVIARGAIGPSLQLGAGFHPELSGRDNLYWLGGLLGVSRRFVDSRLSNILDFSGIADRIGLPLRQYSTGMTVRLGAALLFEMPFDVFLFDEALGCLDIGFRKLCFERIASAAASGKSFLIVSHDASTLAHCDRVLTLEHGRVVSETTGNSEARPALNSFAIPETNPLP